MIEERYVHSPADRAPPRIGLLIDSTTLPRWAAAIVDGIDHCDYADICWIGVNALESDPALAQGSRADRRGAPAPQTRLTASRSC